MSFRLQKVATRPIGYLRVVCNKTYTKEHSEDEWESMRETIGKLYITEKRKLKETMTILEVRYEFSATEQMFKKRLKKWNFGKRTYRKVTSEDSAAPTPIVKAVVDTNAEIETEEINKHVQYPSTSTADDQASPSSSTSLEEHQNQYDRGEQMTLVSPSNQGPNANFEHVLVSISYWSQSKLESCPIMSDPMSAYLANLSSPPIQDSRTMYRIFELCFNLWCRGEGGLAGMAARRGFYLLEFVLHEDHPDMLWHILDTIFDMAWKGHLDLLGMFLEYATVLAKPKFADLHPLRLILQELRNLDSHNKRGFLCGLLRQAWLRNVDLLGEHIETSEAHQLWLYEQLIWDGRTPLRKGSDLVKQEKAIYQALERMDPAQSQTSNIIDTDRLRVKALRLEFTQMDVGDRVKAEELANDLLEIESVTGPRLTDRFHAYAYKMLARVQEEKEDWDMAEQHLQYAISKRESAHARESDLRVISDMWVLEAHYQKAGRESEAKNIANRALKRANECVRRMITGINLPSNRQSLVSRDKLIIRSS